MADILDSQKTWDIIIVGGGVVGCAIARRLALAGATVLVLEKGGDILSGASKANSAILHTGFDAPTGTLEHACIRAGYEEYLNIHERFNLPLWKTSALVAAWSEDQLQKLPSIVEKAYKNGITDVYQIDAKEVLTREPYLANHVKGGVVVPCEYLIDPWSAPLAYIQQAILLGASIVRRCAVENGNFDGLIWTLKTSKGNVKGRTVINCAGLSGDKVEEIIHPSPFVIKPRKGQFIVYDKSASVLLKSILLPVPTERTKGIVLTRTVFGNLLLGPTAEEQDDRDHPFVDEDVLRQLKEQGEQMLPGLRGETVTAVYAGLRPATEKPEYRIDNYPEKHWICVGGIRSTGLTASLGIAQHIEKLLSEHELSSSLKPVAEENVPWFSMPVLDQEGNRDFTRPGYESIVCHCELVTKREIIATLNSTLPPGDLGGLRRRTRLMMGRCQGFYCSSTIAKMTDERFGLVLGESTHD
ncbi:FAD/NAD(P)-binding oxidoreductase [Betaproteobacteria bacterium]|nr:FAD/NAD(P)-binding oxidoreductase [Betaproteobacteria bacterium]